MNPKPHQQMQSTSVGHVRIPILKTTCQATSLLAIRSPVTPWTHIFGHFGPFYLSWGCLYLFQPLSTGLMKRFLSILTFCLFLVSLVSAQGNGNGGYGNNGNGTGNGNGNGGIGNNGFGQGNSPWANVNWPQWLINWLENGGQIPPLVAADVIWEARGWGMQHFGFTYFQMLQKYHQGQFSIQYISTAPPSLTFRLRHLGGLDITVLINI
jgi:hypothetical protein